MVFFDIYGRILHGLSQDFSNGGEKRLNAKKNADSLCSELKEFMSKDLPLLQLISLPGMREKHWHEIESVTGLVIPLGEQLSLSMMTALGASYPSIFFHFNFISFLSLSFPCKL